MKILLLGANGQLGDAVRGAATGRHDLTPLTRAEVDITNSAALDDAVRSASPDAIINCAAFARVDEAEDEPVEAFKANANAVRTLARAAAASGAILVHYSSDFVFDGAGGGPNTEATPPNPRGAYAMSKLVGEWLAADAPRHFVFRVESLFGGARRKSSIDGMLENILAGRPVMAFSDRSVSPSYVLDVAAATLAAIERPIPFGLYHCVNSGATTWSALARELARLAGRPGAEILDTKMADLTMRVRRPLNAAMSNEKLKSAGVAMPAWQDALERHVRARTGQGAS